MTRTRKIHWAFLACCAIYVQGCAPVRPPQPPAPPIIDTFNVACVVTDAFSHQPIAGASCTITGQTAPTNGDGYALLLHLLGGPGVQQTLGVSKEGYLPAGKTFTNDRDQNVAIALTSDFPEPPTRDEILDAHESFQGSVLHTAQFGDLNWWPPAWVSLSDADRAASYAQIASWGDTDITVVASWHYGEPGQPYGSGQPVPDRDFVSTGQLATFRALVKEVIQHKAANGKPFVPVVFAEGDNGFSYYMWAMPQIVAALQPQPGDLIDLTRYVNFRMCYDSCVPGWQPPSQVDEAILATRAACPNCVISMEFSSGYPCWGGGDGCGAVNFQSPAGQALDNIDWEGNSWPPNNWEQYYQVLGRLLGPAYRRPPEQVSDPGGSTWYLRGGTPRGHWGVHCLEPFTYQWVRGKVPAAQVPVAFKTLSDMGCPVIDLPVPR